MPPGPHRRLEDPLLAWRVDGARGRLRAAFHEGQDLRALRSHLSYIRKHHSSAPAALYYLVMVGRLTLATLWQTMRWLGGSASLADVRERSHRQMQFALLRPGRTGG